MPGCWRGCTPDYPRITCLSLRSAHAESSRIKAYLHVFRGNFLALVRCPAKVAAELITGSQLSNIMNRAGCADRRWRDPAEEGVSLVFALVGGAGAVPVQVLFPRPMQPMRPNAITGSCGCRDWLGT